MTKPTGKPRVKRHSKRYVGLKGTKVRVTGAIKHPKKYPHGRPRIELNLNVVRELAKSMATEREMCAAIGIDYSTWKKRKNDTPGMREAIEEGRAKGCFSLRAAQMKAAVGGNTQMLKWCGMQYLKQSHNMKHSNDPENPMPASVNVKALTFGSPEEAMAAFDAMLKDG